MRIITNKTWPQIEREAYLQRYPERLGVLENIEMTLLDSAYPGDMPMIEDLAWDIAKSVSLVR